MLFPAAVPACFTHMLWCWKQHARDAREAIRTNCRTTVIAETTVCLGCSWTWCTVRSKLSRESSYIKLPQTLRRKLFCVMAIKNDLDAIGWSVRVAVFVSPTNCGPCNHNASRNWFASWSEWVCICQQKEKQNKTRCRTGWSQYGTDIQVQHTGVQNMFAAVSI